MTKSWFNPQNLASFKKFFLILMTSAFCIFFSQIAYTASLEDAKRAYEKKDYKVALEIYTSLAKSNHSQAQYELSEMYEYGVGVSQDCKTAKMWRRKSKQNGYEPEFTFFYDPSYTPERFECTHTVEWWLEDAEDGDSEAQLIIGKLYFFGRNLERNYTKAIKWFRLASKNGNSEAQYLLGSIYEAGKLLPKDYVQAYRFYNCSASVSGALASDWSNSAIRNLENKMTSDQIFEAQERTCN